MHPVTDAQIPARNTEPPRLSLILCSRNDSYMGNSRWRLQTTLEFLARNVSELGRERDVELVVVDWGSEVPLHEVVELTPNAARIASFLPVPPDLAREMQRESAFSEVHALNAAARRTRGQYIGRIDADTLVGKRFLSAFFEWVDGARPPPFPIETSFVWANRRGIPYRLASRSPDQSDVERFVHWFGRRLAIDTPGRVEFFDAPVGIWLVPRALWEACGGYDERMIYWGNMENDMIYRLRKRYRLIHLDDHLDCDFYHLEHYPPLLERVTPRRMNPNEDDNVFFPNDENWGLARHPLELAWVPGKKSNSDNSSAATVVSWPWLLVIVSVRVASDRAVLWARAQPSFQRWVHRLGRLRRSIEGEPVHRWPGTLRRLWLERRARLRNLERDGPR
jgi:hypothetical protein